MKLYILIFILFLSLKCKNTQDWELISFDPNDKELSSIIDLSLRTIREYHPNTNHQLLEVYYVSILGDYYKIAYALQNRSKHTIKLINVYVEKHIKKDGEITKKVYLVEEVGKTKDISIHDPFYVYLQKTILEELLKKGIILSYINKIELYDERYYVVYAQTYKEEYEFFVLFMGYEEFKVIHYFFSRIDKPYI